MNLGTLSKASKSPASVPSLNNGKSSLETNQIVSLKEALGESRMTKPVEAHPASPVGASKDKPRDVPEATRSASSKMTDPSPHDSPLANGDLSNGFRRASETPRPESLSQLDLLREQIGDSITELQSLLRAIRAPVPTQTGDGTELPQKERSTPARDLKQVFRDINSLGLDKIEDLAQVFIHAKRDEPLNDKKYYMEHLIQAAASLPPKDLLSKSITNTLLTTLWKDLDHPPQMLLSDEFVYRQPDGSKNNYAFPQIGAAGMPYARTVPPKTFTAGAMPDPGVLFDTVMARKHPDGEEHPNKVSSVLFYLASIIIHDVFKTSHDDYNISNTSSYLDLAPLYGSDWEEQKRMRTMKDGKIKPDCFSETRLLTFPPGVGALLIMFNRYHNWVVEQLALINEDERFTENPKRPDVDRYGERINKRDDDLFQTGRLITCGLYINIILIDYVRTILNLNKTNVNWELNPRAEIPDGPAEGTGNQVSCEFNLVYRWHAAISRKDDLWTQQLFKQLFPDIAPEDVAQPQNMPLFLRKLGELEQKMGGTDPEDRQFPALESETIERIKEGPYKGNFRDDDIAALLTEGIEDCANAMGPQQVPTVMKAIEMLGIMQARTWRVATLNEFRKHFDLAPHHTFESITDNAEVAEALKHLYDTPDNVELYPGLVVEDAKRPMLPGSGLCPSYTVSRGVLSDAVALVRGDRFYTTSYTPAALTNWGYQEASSDSSIDTGCVFYKLFLRALPHNYDPASVYVHYPMTVPHGPDGMQDVLEQLGKAHRYTFDRPKPLVRPTLIFSYDAAKQILIDQDTFGVTWGKAMQFLMGDAAKNFMLAGDGPANKDSRKLMETALYQGGSIGGKLEGNEKWLQAVRDYYEQKTTQILKEKSYKLAGISEVDIIRDVGNIVHVHFASEMFSVPLKTNDFPRGIFTEHQLYLIFAAVFTCVFFDLDPPKSFPLRQQAYDATQKLGAVMQLMVAAIQSTGKIASSIIDYVKPASSMLGDYGVHMIAELLKQNPNVSELVWGNMLPTLGGIVANQGQLFGQVIDFFTTEGQEHLPVINKLAKEDTPEADVTLTHYLWEAARLSGETGVFRSVKRDVVVDDSTELLGKRTHELKVGEQLMINLKAVARDPKAFPNPDQLELDRPLESYLALGHGPHQCLGLPMTSVALTTMLKVVARLDGLRPAPVTVGKSFRGSEVKKVVREFISGNSNVLPESWHYHAYLTEDWDMYFPFPTTLKVNWDGNVPDYVPREASKEA